MTCVHSRLVVSQSGNSGQSVKQARKQSSKQASAQSQSVSYLLISVFTVPPRAHPSAALQTPSTFTITFKIVIILGKTHVQSRVVVGPLSITILYSERVLRARDEIRPECSEMRLENEACVMCARCEAFAWCVVNERDVQRTSATLARSHTMPSLLTFPPTPTMNPHPMHMVLS